MRCVLAFAFFLSFVGLGYGQTCEEALISQFTTTFESRVQRIVFANHARTDIYLATADGSIYRSTDAGETFLPIMDSMPDFYNTFGTSYSGVYAIIRGGTDGLVFFVGSSAKIYWVTRGDGVYKSHETGEDYIYSIDPHPEDPNLVIRGIVSCSDRDTCYPKIEISEAQGTEGSWSLVRDYVYEYSWGSQQNQIFLVSVSDELLESGEAFDSIGIEQRQLFLTYNFGSSYSYTSPLGFYDFLFDNGVLYIASYNEETAYSDLFISADSGDSVIEAEFNSRTGLAHIESEHYSVLDSTEGVSFISICTSEEEGDGTVFQAYLSDGEYAENLDHQRGSCGGAYHGVDFQKIHGLTGIFFSNTYHPDAFLSNDTDLDQYIQSKISFDKGGSWETIPAPESSTCSGDSCHLNFFSVSDSTSSVLSASTAAGVLIATGNEGEFRSNSDANTYLSRNGGFTWELIANGNYSYTIAAHGSLFVMTPKEPSDSIQYSWTQGENWEFCDMFEQEFLVSTLMDISSDSSEPTLLMAGANADESTYFVSFVAFTDAAPRTCEGFTSPGNEDSDYEAFIPEANGSCLLGQQISVIRRKRSAECLSVESEVHNVLDACECTRQDYSCDGNCWKEQAGDDGKTICVNACVGQEGDPEAPPQDCELTYMKPSGYRYVQGDSCEGGLSLAEPIETACPGYSSTPSVSPSAGASPSTQPSSEPFPSLDSTPSAQASGNDGQQTNPDGTESDGASIGLIIGGIALFLLFILFVLIVGLIFLYKTNTKVRGLINTYLPASLGGGSGDTKLYSVLGDDQGGSLFMSDDMFLDEDVGNSPVSTDNTPLGSLLDFDDDDAEGAIDIQF